MIQVKMPFVCLAQQFKLLIKTPPSTVVVEQEQKTGTNTLAKKQENLESVNAIQPPEERAQRQFNMSIQSVQKLDLWPSNANDIKWDELLYPQNPQSPSDISNRNGRNDIDPHQLTRQQSHYLKNDENAEEKAGQDESGGQDGICREGYGISDSYRIVIRFDANASTAYEQSSDGQQLANPSVQQYFQQMVEGVNIHVHPCFKMPNAS